MAVIDSFNLVGTLNYGVGGTYVNGAPTQLVATQIGPDQDPSLNINRREFVLSGHVNGTNFTVPSILQITPTGASIATQGGVSELSGSTPALHPSIGVTSVAPNINPDDLDASLQNLVLAAAAGGVEISIEDAQQLLASALTHAGTIQYLDSDSTNPVPDIPTGVKILAALAVGGVVLGRRKGAQGEPAPMELG